MVLALPNQEKLILERSEQSKSKKNKEKTVQKRKMMQNLENLPLKLN
jgi:hypothetical protein